MTLSRSTALATFGAALITAYGASLWLAGQLGSLDVPVLVAAAMVVDLTVLVPGLYYVVFVRGRGWPLPTVGIVFILSLLGATLVLPSVYHAPLRAVEWLVLPLEGLIVGWSLLRLGKAARAARSLGGEEDVLARCRTIFSALGEGRARDMAAYEVALIYYALGRWRTPLPQQPGAFSLYRQGGYQAVLVALLIGTAVELVGVHILVALWSTAAAWVLTGLSLYGILWIVGDFQALRHRPLRLEADRLYLRLGMRWEVEVPLDAVVDITPLARAPQKQEGYLDMTVFGAPRYLVRLNRPLTAHGPYGWRKDVRSVGFAVDDRERFEDALQDGAWEQRIAALRK